MQGRCVCGDWDCPYHGSVEDYLAPEPCKNCDKQIHRPAPYTVWLHVNGSEFCHLELNDSLAEPLK
jgi:hypothetical protein